MLVNVGSGFFGYCYGQEGGQVQVDHCCSGVEVVLSWGA